MLKKWRIQENYFCRYNGRSKPAQWVYKKVRNDECKDKGRGGVCKQMIGEGEDPALDGNRSRHQLRIVNNIHKLAVRQEENQEPCNDASTITKEASVPEVDLHKEERTS